MRVEWPEWWEWELDLTGHVETRMEDRGFSEVELRAMLERARSMAPDVMEGRWRVATTFEGAVWIVIVEPDPEAAKLVVITAFPVTR